MKGEIEWLRQKLEPLHLAMVVVYLLEHIYHESNQDPDIHWRYKLQPCPDICIRASKEAHLHSQI